MPLKKGKSGYPQKQAASLNQARQSGAKIPKPKGAEAKTARQPVTDNLNRFMKGK